MGHTQENVKLTSERVYRQTVKQTYNCCKFEKVNFVTRSIHYTYTISIWKYTVTCFTWASPPLVTPLNSIRCYILNRLLKRKGCSTSKHAGRGYSRSKSFLKFIPCTFNAQNQQNVVLIHNLLTGRRFLACRRWNKFSTRHCEFQEFESDHEQRY